MGNIHFIGGEKGGVGKSMTSRLLAQYLIDAEQPFIGLDSDQSHESFSRFYGDYSLPLKISDLDSLDKLVTMAEENPERDLIIDLAAQTAEPLRKWHEESDGLAVLNELGNQIYMWHVMDDGAESVQLLDKLLETYPYDYIQFVVASNLGRGIEFDPFVESETFSNAANRRAIFIILPRLQTQLVQAIDFNSTSFWAAANNPNVMNTIQRSRVRVWLKKTYEQFHKLGILKTGTVD